MVPKLMNPEACAVCHGKSSNPICSLPEGSRFIEHRRRESAYQPGEKIFSADEKPAGLYLIRSGIMKLQALGKEGSVGTLRFYGPGQALGYRSLFANTPYQATAIAMTPATVCFLAAEDVETIVKTIPQAALNLLSCLSHDLHSADEKWIQQIEQSASERIAEALLFLCDHFPNQKWSRREIAEWAGTTTETVIRTLAIFERERLVSSEDRVFRILDRASLLART